MPSRRLLPVLLIIVLVGMAVYIARPYARAAALFARVGNVGGRLEAIAESSARRVAIDAIHMVPTRQGGVPAQFYRPEGEVRRSVLLVPGSASRASQDLPGT
jgi:hypothetical protein